MTQELKMLDLLKKMIQSLTGSYQNELDQYIKERNPKNAADVERIVQEYTYRQMRGWS